MSAFKKPIKIWPVIDPKKANNTRYAINKRNGHYENYFLRANHPTKPLAFWIRYTIFSPDNKKTAIGEVWATYFDGETGNHACAKSEFPIGNCVFYSNELNVTIGNSRLNENHFQGRAATGDQILSWDLNYTGNEAPLFLLQRTMYDMPFPKAKVLVGKPLAIFSGTININGIDFSVDKWIGSQNHNWGVKHTDHYAWGQVAGFDTHPGSFLEVATARLKMGPFWTPFMTIIVLRHEGREYRLNSIPQSLRAKGSFDYFEWNFSSETPEEKISGNMKASVDQFVGLNYYNPSGGVKHCLNTKIASCEITLTHVDDPEHQPVVLKTEHRAAFEILTDDQNHGVAIRA
ncbi:hypothetical protein MHK_007885 [Candidatus Magnetomorum sp. HK-1]|nr:hypothetical protein MHK_007885 [Candidatus Magnetomorum sp. HK-1]